jgi:hypothetical protein
MLVVATIRTARPLTPGHDGHEVGIAEPCWPRAGPRPCQHWRTALWRRNGHLSAPGSCGIETQGPGNLKDPDNSGRSRPWVRDCSRWTFGSPHTPPGRTGEASMWASGSTRSRRLIVTTDESVRSGSPTPQMYHRT